MERREVEEAILVILSENHVYADHQQVVQMSFLDLATASSLTVLKLFISKYQ